jgi:hypothetical protein
MSLGPTRSNSIIDVVVIIKVSNTIKTFPPMHLYIRDNYLLMYYQKIELSTQVLNLLQVNKNE